MNQKRFKYYSNYESEKVTINNKLNEQILEFDKLKNEYEKKILEVKQSFKDKIINLEKEINEKNNIIKILSERNQYFTNYTKSFDSQKTNLENEISKIKKMNYSFTENLQNNKILLLKSTNLSKNWKSISSSKDEK